MKEIVCDSSSLISLAENSFLWLLPELKLNLVLPTAVKKEIIDQPMKSPKFEMNAIRLKEALNKGWINLVDDDKVFEKAGYLSNLANSIFSKGEHYVRILHQGEAESLALIQDADLNVLLIDERTTRLLIEDVGVLQKYMENRMNVSLKVDTKAVREFKDNFQDERVIRSSEVVALAYEKGVLQKRLGNDDHLLHAALYSLKFSGCAITKEEILEYMVMFGV